MENCQQIKLPPGCLDGHITADNPVLLIVVFVDELDLTALGFAAMGRLASYPAMLLEIYLKRISSSRRLERERPRNIELIWLTGRRMSSGEIPRSPQTIYVV